MKDGDRYEEVLGVIRTLAQEGTIPPRLKRAKLGPKTKVDKLGLDSMGLVSLITEIEIRTHTTLSDNLLATVTTLEDLAGALADASEGN